MIINVLTNYKDEFLLSSKALGKEKKPSMNIELLKYYSKEFHIEFKFIHFNEISFAQNDYKDQFFLYTTSEDPDLLYRSYIEDIIIGLKLQGAFLIPDFYFLHAHHNKVFMEILRDILLKKIDTGISSMHFGTLEDFRRCRQKISLPSVIKKASSAGSRGVALLKSKIDLDKIPRKFSRSLNIKESLKEVLRIWSPYSKYRNKFIIQNFISGLNSDFRILIFWDKYYIMGRKIMKNDFRASGSGSFIFDVEVPVGLLDFAEKIYSLLHVPIIALDLAYLEKRFFLFEFQFLHFGTSAIEKSLRYYIRENTVWKRINDTSILEREFVRAIVSFIKANSK